MKIRLEIFILSESEREDRVACIAEIMEMLERARMGPAEKVAFLETLAGNGKASIDRCEFTLGRAEREIKILREEV